MRGHHLAPTQKGGGKGQRGCGLSGQKEVTVLWPGHPRPQGPAGLLPPPGWGRVNTAAGSSRYLYRDPGVGPVPTTAPALPCPPQPAPSQRGTGRQGDAAAGTASLHSAQRPLDASLGTPAASLGTQDAPLPWRHQHKCSPARAAAREREHTPPKTPKRQRKIETHAAAHTLKSSAHMWGHRMQTPPAHRPHRG